MDVRGMPDGVEHMEQPAGGQRLEGGGGWLNTLQQTQVFCRPPRQPAARFRTARSANSIMSNGGPIIAIVGATGAVGKELVSVLYDRKTKFSNLRLMASARSAGKALDTPFGSMTVEEFCVEKARECDVVLMSVSGGFATRYAREIISGNDGAVVIDNSSAFRYDPAVPLVVPEINATAIGCGKLVANPNCTTAIAVMVLSPLHRKYKIKKIIMSTYQAASGAGAEGMDELLTGSAAYCAGETVENSVFSHQLPFNLIPHIDAFQDNGYTKEEMKVAWETRKIMDDDSIDISCTAVRVPTMRAHAEAITIETEKPIPADEARALLEAAPGVVVVDDTATHRYPMPVNATGKDDVEVGRIRQSLVFRDYGLDMFVCGDQLLRGAALNAVLIWEAITKS